MWAAFGRDELPENRGGHRVVRTRTVRPVLVLAVLCLSLLVVTTQISILNVALPSLILHLGATETQLQWIINAYTVAFAGVLLTGAALADRFGRRGVMVGGLLLCGAGSLAAALSSAPEQLIVWRTVMGIGGALVMPATLSILVNVFTEPRPRSRAIATWTLMHATGSFIGPLGGGLLLEWWSWSACFYVSIPLAVLAVVGSLLWVPTSRDPAAASFDMLGAALSTGTLALLIWGVIEGAERGWTSPPIVGSFVLALVLGVAFVRWERRTSSPMLDLSVLRVPALRASSISLVIAFVAMSSAMYLSMLSLQLGKGYSALAAAAVTAIPITLVNFLVVPFAPRLIARFGTRVLVSAGVGTIAVSSLVIATMTATSGVVPLLIGFALMAAAFSIYTPASTEAIVTSVPPESSGGASALTQLTRQIGQSLGVALGGGIAAMGFRAQFDPSDFELDPADRKLAGSSFTGALEVVERVDAAVREAFLLAARQSFVVGVRYMLVVCAVLAVIGAIYAAVAIPGRNRPADETGDETDPVGGETVAEPR